MLVIVVVVVVDPLQHGMEIHICCIAETFSHHLETEEVCWSDSLGDDVLSCCVCPGAEGFVSGILSASRTFSGCFVYG